LLNNEAEASQQCLSAPDSVPSRSRRGELRAQNGQLCAQLHRRSALQALLLPLLPERYASPCHVDCPLTLLSEWLQAHVANYVPPQAIPLDSETEGSDLEAPLPPPHRLKTRKRKRGPPPSYASVMALKKREAEVALEEGST
jgi:hypothetical protein